MDSKTAGELCIALLLGEEDPKQLAAGAVAQSVYVQANRNGFMRRVLARQVLEIGEFPTHRTSGKVRFATSAVRYEDTICMDKYFSAPEIVLETRPALDKEHGRERFGDMMSRAEEAMYVGEDRLLSLMLQPNTSITLNKDTPLVTLDALLDAADFDPLVLAIGSHVYNGLLADNAAVERYTPSNKLEEIKTGLLGTFKSKDGTKEVALISDAYRHPEHRIFDFDTMVLLSNPLELGQYTDRGGYQGTAISKKVDDEIEYVGVQVASILSMVINPARYLRAKEK